MKPVTLPARHYASSWKTEDAIRPIEEINDLGRRYFEMPVEAPSRQELLLEVCQAFHPYLMKYLVMICRGHVPIVGQGKDRFRVNKDVEAFLYYLMPKGEPRTQRSLNTVARHLHLAFKGMETDEIYDVLMEQLIRTIGKYDPDYKQKLRVVVEAIQNELPKRKPFTAADVNHHLDLDLRSLSPPVVPHWLPRNEAGKEKSPRV